MNKLLPCPFCGGEVELIPGLLGGYQVYCRNDFDKCGVAPMTLTFVTEAEAIAAWNCRAEGTYELTESEAIAAWNNRAERTCRRFWTGAEMICSSCAHQLNATANYCPNCGCKVVS